MFRRNPRRLVGIAVFAAITALVATVPMATPAGAHHVPPRTSPAHYPSQICDDGVTVPGPNTNFELSTGQIRDLLDLLDVLDAIPGIKTFKDLGKEILKRAGSQLDVGVQGHEDWSKIGHPVFEDFCVYLEADAIIFAQTLLGGVLSHRASRGDTSGVIPFQWAGGMCRGSEYKWTADNRGTLGGLAQTAQFDRCVGI